MASSPAIDVVAIGLDDGRVIVHNLRVDQTIVVFTQRTAVTALAFRSDEQAWLASGDARGQIALWSLEAQSLLAVLPRAHGQGGDAQATIGTRTDARDTFGTELENDDDDDDKDDVRMVDNFDTVSGRGVTQLAFLAGEPVLISSGGDNALKMWFCEADTVRLLRERAGHGKAPALVKFYDGFSNGGFGASRELLSAAADNSLRMFSLIQDHQSCELSQGKLAKTANRLGRHVASIKLPPVTALAAVAAREKQWDNVVTAHANRSTARTWSYVNRRLGKNELRLTDKKVSVVRRAVRALNAATAQSPESVIRCVAMSACGSFALLGSSAGWIDKYNVQSGAHRGTAKWSKKLRRAHSSAVTGLACDPLNRWLISCSLDSTIKWWRFNDLEPLSQCVMDSPASFCEMHFAGQLLAVACDDLIVRVYDAEQRRLVRRLWPTPNTDDDSETEDNDSSDNDDNDSNDNDNDSNDNTDSSDQQQTSTLRKRPRDRTAAQHSAKTRRHDDDFAVTLATAQVTSLAFSPDARWLVTAALDAVRVFDVPAGVLIDWFRCERPVTSLAFAPSGDFLATTHVNRRGVYLWANAHYFGHVFLRTPSRRPPLADLPRALRVRTSNDEYVDGADAGESDDDQGAHASGANATTAAAAEKEAWASGEALAAGLVTLSDVPRAQWQMLAQLDIIKQRNKPLAPPTKPDAAPFFLPTLPGLEPEFVVGDEDNEAEQDNAASRFVDFGKLRPRSAFLDLLLRSPKTDDEYRQLANLLSQLSPSKVDAELRQLRGSVSPSGVSRAAIFGGDAEDDVCEHSLFLDFVLHELSSGRHFELLQAWLEVFLRVHATDLLANAAAHKLLAQLQGAHHDVWQRLDSLYESSLCLLDHFAGLNMEF